MPSWMCRLSLCMYKESGPAEKPAVSGSSYREGKEVWLQDPVDVGRQRLICFKVTTHLVMPTTSPVAKRLPHKSLVKSWVAFRLKLPQAPLRTCG